MTADKLRVGVAQIDVAIGRLQQNLDKHLHYVDRAKDEGLDLVVFPETSLTGYPHGVVTEFALRRDSEPLQRLADAARGIVVVAGFVEEAPAAQFYNTCMVVSDGQLMHLHRKLNLATYGNLEEGKLFALGRYVDAFNLGQFWRVTTLVCADAWNPALVYLGALHGSTLLIIPTNSAEDGVSSEFSNPDGWDLAIRFYAMIYGMPIVMANRVGTEANLRFWGGSCVVDPFGAVVATAGRRDEELLVAEVDYADVRRARVQLPTVRDSNLSLVHREISRLLGLIGVPAGIR